MKSRYYSLLLAGAALIGLGACQPKDSAKTENSSADSAAMASDTETISLKVTGMT